MVTFPRAYGWCCGFAEKPGLPMSPAPNVAGFAQVLRFALENLPMSIVLVFNW